MPADNLELSVRSQSDLDDQHDYDSVASDEDTDQEPLRSAGATRNNRARVCAQPPPPAPPPPGPGTRAGHSVGSSSPSVRPSGRPRG